MTLDETVDLLTPLALAMRAPLGVPTFKAYHAVLKNVPMPLAAAALDQLTASGLRFFPSAPEIQAASERVRRQQLALQPWTPCCECEDTPRWRAAEIDGVTRMERCPCVGRHQAVLAERGLLEPIAMLPGEAGVGENEQAYPDVQQIPESVRLRLQAIAGQKVLR